MQERELREGSVRRCEVERRRLRWPSAAGADPAASSGAPPRRGLSSSVSLCERRHRRRHGRRGATR
eukprot:505332-Pleurochrysis_carterae.AAC.2